MASPTATPTPSHHRHRHPPAITAVQGIAGSIDRFGQSFGPILGGWLLDLVGQVALALTLTLTLTLTLSLSRIACAPHCAPSRRQGPAPRRRARS